MLDSRSQRDLLHGLQLWAEVRGIALVTRASGVGTSITLRRFTQGVDESRSRVIHLANMPTPSSTPPTPTSPPTETRAAPTPSSSPTTPRASGPPSSTSSDG